MKSAAVAVVDVATTATTVAVGHGVEKGNSRARALMGKRPK